VAGAPKVEGTDYTVSGGVLTFTTAPANAAAISIVRSSGIASRLVTLADGTVPLAADLNKDGLQAFYLAQEMADGAGSGNMSRSVYDPDADGVIGQAQGGTGATTLAAASLTATGSTTARTLGARFAEMFNVKDFGAVGDGVTNDRPAILAAEVAAFAAGGIVYFPPGATYAINSTAGRVGFRVPVRGYGATIKFTAVRDKNATITNYLESGTQATDITIEGLTIDGNNLCRGVFLTNAHRSRVHRCTIKNCKDSGIAVFDSDDVEVSECAISNVRYEVVPSTGAPADGIYFAGCQRGVIRNNRISDFRRIGIVSESDGSTKSYKVRIVENTISNGNNCDDSTTEYNAGIWVENTNGATVASNRIYSMGGNSGQTSGRIYGMVAVGGSEAPSSECVMVMGNHISVWTGSANPASVAVYMTGSGAYQDVKFLGNHIADCGKPISIGTGLRDILIRDVSIDNVKWTAGSDSLITVDNGSGTSCSSLTIDNVRFSNLTDGDATNECAHLTLWTSAAVPKLSISRIYGWNMVCRGTNTIGRLDITDAEILYGSASTYGCLKAAEIYAKGVKFGNYAARGMTKWMDSTAGAIKAHFTACQFYGDGGADAFFVNGANGVDVIWTGCSFHNGGGIWFKPSGGTSRVTFSGCRFDEFGTWGAFNSGAAAGTVSVSFIGNYFTRSTAVTAIQKNSAQPAKSRFAYNAYAGSMTTLHDYTTPTQDVGTVAM
jgi:parallel beta-helix repeat protein